MKKAILLSILLLAFAVHIAHANLPPVDEPRGGTVPQVTMHYVYLPLVEK